MSESSERHTSRRDERETGSGRSRSSSSSRSSHRSRQSKEAASKSRRNKTIVWSIVGVFVVLIACGAWVGIRALLAKSELEAAVPLASELKSVALQNDAAGVSRVASELHKHATAARDLTGDPIWRVAEVLPVLGPNLGAARELAATVSDLSTNAVGPLTRLVSSVELSDFKPTNGAINLQPLVEAQPSVEQASASLKAANKRVNAINTSQTVAPVTKAVQDLRTQLQELTPPIQALSNAVALAPAMLGNDGPRDYLLLFQNPAELRSSGGIPGAMALIHTENGKIELTQQASSSEFPHYDSPVIDVPEETRGIYGDIVGEYIQDVTLTPDFDMSARLARQMWKDRFGAEVDGVISIDPVALSYLLGATGPVSTVTGDTLTAENSVPMLLNEAYLRYSVPAQQDAFFAASAKAVFDKLSAGDIDPVKMIAALTRAGEERRLLVWNENPAEQNVLLGTTLAGELVGSQPDGAQIGMYLNDGTGGKMDYYLKVDTSIGSIGCRDDGRQNIGLTVTLTNTAPADASTSLPAYLTGNGLFGVPPGNIRTIVSAYGAPEMVNLGVSENDAKIAAHSASDRGRPVNQVTSELAPGQSQTFTFAFLGSKTAITADDLQMTPIINMNETSELALTCESALW